ncbi:hypothetical protein [Halorubrum gandharaense]
MHDQSAPTSGHAGASGRSYADAQFEEHDVDGVVAGEAGGELVAGEPIGGPQ